MEKRWKKDISIGVIGGILFLLLINSNSAIQNLMVVAFQMILPVGYNASYYIVANFLTGFIFGIILSEITQNIK